MTSMTSVACARAAPITSMIWVDFDGCVVRACVFWGATADRLGGLEALCFASLCLDALSCLSSSGFLLLAAPRCWLELSVLEVLANCVVR